jgi:hypothetical protein
MKKILISAILMIGNFGVVGHVQASSYQMYRCTDTNSCSGQCVSHNGRSVVFLTNKQKSIVMAQYFEGGKLKSSDTHENCKVVFDDKNWDCSSQMDHRNGTIFVSIKMTNGIYQAKTTSFAQTPNGLVTSILVDVCAR